VPENLLAAFWDDLDFGATPRAYYHSDGSRLVVQYQDVARAEQLGVPNSFEVILESDGTIVFQYLSMMGVVYSATIGIQNATRDTALQVNFNASYVHDGLAVQFRRPTSGFLGVAPAGGTVAPGQHRDLDVTFDAADLPPGEYSGVLRIVGNDPFEPAKDVPCRLTVTLPLAVPGTPDPSQFGLSFVGANPARESARLELAVPVRAEVTVQIFDVRGALVSQVARREFEPGRHSIGWDGTNSAGRRAGAGIYFVRAVTPTGTLGLRLALLR